MARRLKLCVFVFFGFLFLLAPLFFVPIDVFAQGQFVGDQGPPGIVPCGDPNEPECGLCHLVDLGTESLRFAVYLSVFVATALFVYAGFLYVTAGGDSGKISSATRVFWNVIIGLLIVLLAWLIVDTILKGLLNEAEFGPWNKIECSG